MKVEEVSYEKFPNSTIEGDYASYYQRQGFKAGAEWALNEAITKLQKRYEGFARQGDQDACHYVQSGIDMLTGLLK